MVQVGVNVLYSCLRQLVKGLFAVQRFSRVDFTKFSRVDFTKKHLIFVNVYLSWYFKSYSYGEKYF